MSSPITTSIADAFIVGTLDVQMQSLYDKFLPHLAAGSHILDAGCGSGRDSRYFLQQGFEVTALDASWPLVLHARTLSYGFGVALPLR